MTTTESKTSPVGQVSMKDRIACILLIVRCSVSSLLLSIPRRLGKISSTLVPLASRHRKKAVAITSEESRPEIYSLSPEPRESYFHRRPLQAEPSLSCAKILLFYAIHFKVIRHCLISKYGVL